MAALSTLPAISQATVRTFTQLTIVSPRTLSGSSTELRVNVVSANSDTVGGTVTLMDGERAVAGAALQDGEAEFAVNLSGGDHELSAVYAGDDAHQSSTSGAQGFHNDQQMSMPSYSLAMNPAGLTLTAGQSGNSTVTLTASNNQSSTGPTFFTISCSGLPANTSCFFTPETLEIPAGSNSSVVSYLTLQTQASTGVSQNMPPGAGSGIVLAILLPGMFGLGLIARKRSSLARLMLLGMFVLVASVGLSGCNPRYNYINHHPPLTPGTPAGTYTVQINAQTNNGVTATNVTTSLSLTVQ